MSIDPIIARAQQALAASLREAYYAGRGDAAVALKEKVLALVDELIAPPHFGDPSHAETPPPPPASAAPAPAETPPAPHAAETAAPTGAHETVALPEHHAEEPHHEAPPAHEGHESQHHAG